jgi:hypothetical protein
LSENIINQALIVPVIIKFVPQIKNTTAEKTRQITGTFLPYFKSQEILESHSLVHNGMNKEDLTSFCDTQNLSAPYVRNAEDIQFLQMAWSPSSFHSLNSVKSLGRSTFQIFTPGGEIMTQ